jgi:hypothetical protein
LLDGMEDCMGGLGLYGFSEEEQSSEEFSARRAIRKATRSLSPAATSSHASSRRALSHQTTMNRRAEAERLFVSWPSRPGERGEKGRRAGEHPKMPQSSAWRGDTSQPRRQVHLSSGPGRLKSVWPSRVRHFQMVTMVTVIALGQRNINIATSLPTATHFTHLPKCPDCRL